MLKNIIEDCQTILLIEERGFSNEIGDAYSLLISTLNQEIKDHYTTTPNGYLLYGNSELRLFGDFLLKIKYHFEIWTNSRPNSEVASQKEYDCEKQTLSISYYNLYIPDFNLNNFSIDNVSGFSGVICHELKHVLQHYKVSRNSKKDYQDIMRYRDRNVYNIALEELETKSGRESAIGYLIYYTIPSELTAYQEELLANGKKLKREEIANYIESSRIYNDYITIQKLNVLLEDETNPITIEISNILTNTYNRNLKWFSKRLNNAQSYLKRAIDTTEKKLLTICGVHEGIFVDIKESMLGTMKHTLDFFSKK